MKKRITIMTKYIDNTVPKVSYVPQDTFSGIDKGNRLLLGNGLAMYWLNGELQDGLHTREDGSVISIHGEPLHGNVTIVREYGSTVGSLTRSDMRLILEACFHA